MKDKKFYWIKLKTDFFNQDTIDFLLSQNNGCQYVVLYQMLCLKSANNNGELVSNIGEMIVPYDVDKIVRDTKYFDNDTVIVALELFKKLGLIYQEENKTLKISNYDEMVGSETSSAKKVREWRNKKRLQCNQNVTHNVIQEIEYRDKSIENREKNIDIDNTTTNTIYDYTEQNFGRLLTPIEIKKIQSWLLLFNEDIIKYAIELSVISGKKMFSYVDGILKNWQGCNYSTLDEIKNAKAPTKKNSIDRFNEILDSINEEDL